MKKLLLLLFVVPLMAQDFLIDDFDTELVDSLEVQDTLYEQPARRRDYTGEILWHNFNSIDEGVSVHKVTEDMMKRTLARDIEEVMEYYGYPVFRRNYPGTNTRNTWYLGISNNYQQRIMLDNIPIRLGRFVNIFPKTIPFSPISSIDLLNGNCSFSRSPQSNRGGINYNMLTYTPDETFTKFYINMADYDREAITVRSNISYFQPLEIQFALGHQSAKTFVFNENLDDYERTKQDYGLSLGYRLGKYHRVSTKIYQSSFDDYHYDRLKFRLFDARVEGQFPEIVDYMINYRNEMYDILCHKEYDVSTSDTTRLTDEERYSNSIDIVLSPQLFHKTITDTITEEANEKQLVFDNPILGFAYSEPRFSYVMVHDTPSYTHSYKLKQSDFYFSQRLRFKNLTGKVSYLYSGISIDRDIEYHFSDSYDSWEGRYDNHSFGLNLTYRVIRDTDVFAEFFRSNVGQRNTILHNYHSLTHPRELSYRLGLSSHIIENSYLRIEYVSSSNTELYYGWPLVSTWGWVRLGVTYCHPDYNRQLIRSKINTKVADFMEIDINHHHYIFDKNESSISGCYVMREVYPIFSQPVKNYFATRLSFEYPLLEGRFMLRADLLGRFFMGLDEAFLHYYDDTEYIKEEVKNAHRFDARFSAEYWNFQLFFGVDNITKEKSISLIDESENATDPIEPFEKRKLPNQALWQIGINWVLYD